MLRLNRIFSDGCVIQRGVENKIYGASDAKTVLLTLTKNGEQVFSGTVEVGEDHGWEISLPPFEGSSEAYSMTVSAGGETAQIKYIYFGELFHISGQSNMELPLCRTLDPLKDEPPIKENPLIREFRVPVTCRFSKDVQSEDFAGGEWKSAVGADIYDMSATGFYFASDIFARINMPIGLINTSAGGAAVESFMPYDMIRGYKIHDSFLEKATAENFIENTAAADAERERKWFESLGGEDFGLKPSDGMKSCILPCTTDDIEELNGFSGRLYFFREIIIPDDILSLPNEKIQLILGTIVDSDAAFVNGKLVGETAYMYPPRYYDVDKSLLKAGRNTIAVRVEIKGGRGGFTAGKRYCLKFGDIELELSGEWKYAVAARVEPLPPALFFQGEPLALHADMLFPALKIRFKALIWYQGETNCGRASLYRRMFGDFVSYYREKCGYEIPVIFTQLCDFEGMCGCDERDLSWAEMRQAQLSCLEIKNTAMAVTLDIGEYNDLHPKNKRGVGKRLACRAFGLLYGDDVPFIRCIGAEQSADIIELRFSGVLYLKNRSVPVFEAVCDDGVHKCAIESAEGCTDTVRLRCSGKAGSIRYAWANAPRALNLFAPDLTPVSPFVIDVSEK